MENYVQRLYLASSLPYFFTHINKLLLQTIRLIIKGKVQGVYYRQSTREKAQQLGVTGTVKNLADETVEILASGTPEQLKQLTDWCRQGPPRALVADVQEEILTPKNFDGFRIVRI